MARQESEFSLPIHRERSDGIPYIAPAEVTRGTSICLKIIEKDTSLKGIARDFLSSETNGFLKKAQKGFQGNFSRIIKNRNADPRDIRVITFSPEPQSPLTEEDTEAFDFALITMCLMPEYAEHGMLPNGFSRRGMLEPPFTLREFHRRIIELQTLNTEISTADPRSLNWETPEMYRYRYFQEVGGDIPYRIQGSKEVEELARRTWNGFLEDIEM